MFSFLSNISTVLQFPAARHTCSLLSLCFTFPERHVSSPAAQCQGRNADQQHLAPKAGLSRYHISMETSHRPILAWVINRLHLASCFRLFLAQLLASLLKPKSATLASHLPQVESPRSARCGSSIRVSATWLAERQEDCFCQGLDLSLSNTRGGGGRVQSAGDSSRTLT